MIWLNKNRFFNRYLPAILSVILLVVGIGSYFLIKQSKQAQSAWYSSTNGTWNYRQKIIIDHTKINTATGTTTPLNNFPVLISTTNVLFKDITNGGHVGKSDGSDIVFTSGDQLTKLNHEIETYASSTGQLIAWVKIPSLGSQVDTTIYMYYGNQADSNNEQNATGVWDSHYVGVWHLPNGTTLTANDSTGVNNGTLTNSPTATAGQVDGAASFASVSWQSVDVGSNTSLNITGNISITGWVKLNANDNRIIFGGYNGTGSPSFAGYGVGVGKAGAQKLSFWNGTAWKGGNTSILDNTWHYISITNNTNTVFYLDGNSDGTQAQANPSSYVGTRRIGDDSTGGASNALQGAVDELRIYSGVLTSDWIKTEYNNQNSPSTFAAFGGEETQPTAQVNGGWYNASWGYRKKIIINHTQVSGTSTLANFPVLVSIASDPLLKSTANGGHVASTTGADILFTSADGTTKLNHERELYDATTGQLIAWVQVPSVSYTTDTILYMYYGNAAATEQQNAAATWDSNYLGVWHMNQDPTGSAPQIRDSTGNHNGTVGGIWTSSTLQTGEIGNGLLHTYASSTYISYGTINGVRTISMWLKPNSQANSNRPFDYGNNNWSCFQSANTCTTRPVVGSVPITGGSWNYLTANYDGTNFNWYSNGVLRFSGAGTAPANNVFNAGSPAFGGYFDGSIDEVRVSSIARSVDWAKTEYNNQSSPSAFETIAGEETQSATTFNTTWYSANWGYRKPIVIDHRKVNTATGTTTPLTNFPVLINITDTDLKNNASSTGADILFTSSDGKTKLNHEIETYSTSTGQLIAWVQVPSLSNTSDTVLYMYFGNASATDQSNLTAVWDSNFKLVSHLPNGTSVSYSDSTSNANNGTASGTPTAVAGQVGGAASLNGSSYIDYGRMSSTESQSQLTVSFWTNRASLGSNLTSYIMKFNSNNTQAGFAIENGVGSNNILADIDPTGSNGNTYGVTGDNIIPANVWTHVEMVFDGTQTGNANRLKVFINGVAQTLTISGTVPAITPVVTSNVIVGASSDGIRRLTGKMDEVRISTAARSADWISTEYLNQSSPSTFYAVGGIQLENRAANRAGVGIASKGTPSVGNGWYSTSTVATAWGYRKQIVIDHRMVSGTSTLSSFPVLISSTVSEWKSTGNGGKVANNNGYDFVFTSSDGTTQIPHEIETYASTTGQLIAWVKADISPTSDTILYLYYGSSGVSTTMANPAAVWDSNYKAVWHFSNGSTLNLNDSTSNGFSLTNNNSVTAAAGQIDGATATLNGSTQYLSNASLSIAAGSSITISYWEFQTAANVQTASAFSIGNSNVPNRIQAHSPYSDRNLYWDYGDTSGGRVTADYTRYLNAWAYVVLTFDSSGSTHKVFLNGSQAGVSSSAIAPTAPQTGIDIGRWVGPSAYQKAAFDDFRVSTSARTADWIKTEYNNQKSPATFYSIAGTAAQTMPAGTPTMKIKGGVKYK